GEPLSRFARRGKEAVALPRPLVHAIQLAQAYPLPSLRIEILRREPALEGGFARRPFAIEHRKPGIVAVAALGDQMLPERALVNEAVAQRCTARGGVDAFALPAVAPVTQRLEGVACEQILRLGAERRALQRRRIDDMADLDPPHGRPNLHKGGDAERAPAAIDDGVGV